MPEAVIVSAARSPIGRANKGSLKDFRPDDLSALIIKAALDKIPELDPATIDDLIRDKIESSNWSAHLGRSSSPLVNASTWALMLTGFGLAGAMLRRRRTVVAFA